MPDAWEDIRILLLAKKESICAPTLTRTNSLFDIFSKIEKKLFLTRFHDILYRRDLIRNTQSAYSEKFRLQSRVLLFLEEIPSLMANCYPVVTLFVDFKGYLVNYGLKDV